MARFDAGELAIRLGRQAEAVCRHYLSSGHRAGRYWQVGDVRNGPVDVRSVDRAGNR
jgi:hypothetical protein